MEIKKVEFVKSAGKPDDCPKPFYPEIAFIGRSNVGKSSLINFICNNNKLAKVSDTPGKTRTINHYLINGNWYLVDLPGYGFAKLPKQEREKFQKLINDFISQRKTLKCTMVLLDSRLELQNSDKEFILWLANQKLPFAIVLTKIDKLSNAELQKQKNYFEKIFSKIFEELPNIFLTSSEKKIGKEELLEFFDFVINEQE
jgi:GTP-binding protein